MNHGISSWPTPNRSLWLIGDLDGSFPNLLEHLMNLELVDMEWNWIGRDTELILSGDILADRRKDWFKILTTIHHLRKRAQKVCWSIEIIAGNHEEMMLGYLRWKTIQRYTEDDLKHSFAHSSSIWMGELLPYGTHRGKILSEMRRDGIWTIILQEMTRMRLGLIRWRTIHFHTPPSEWILNLLGNISEHRNINIREVLDTINTLWQSALEIILMNNEVDEKKLKDAHKTYDSLAHIFLHTLNGSPEEISKRGWDPHFFRQKIVPGEHPTYEKLLGVWIDTIYHGHTDTITNVPWFQVVSVNRRSEKISF